jgi:hypothetical protein
MFEAALFLKKVVHFKLDPDPNPVPEPEYFPVSVPLRQKGAVSAVPVPQHWREFS